MSTAAMVVMLTSLSTVLSRSWTVSHHAAVLVLYANCLALTRSIEKPPNSLRQGRLHLSSSLEVSGLIAGLAQTQPFQFPDLWGFDWSRGAMNLNSYPFTSYTKALIINLLNHLLRRLLSPSCHRVDRSSFHLSGTACLPSACPPKIGKQRTWISNFSLS